MNANILQCRDELGFARRFSYYETPEDREAYERYMQNEIRKNEERSARWRANAEARKRKAEREAKARQAATPKASTPKPAQTVTAAQVKAERDRRFCAECAAIDRAAKLGLPRDLALQAGRMLASDTEMRRMLEAHRKAQHEEMLAAGRRYFERVNARP
jgi:hypothetical protein